MGRSCSRRTAPSTDAFFTPPGRAVYLRYMARIGADVRIVGVGGAGCNALRRMVERTAPSSATLVAVNTDVQALADHPADRHIVLGRRTTRGLGAGGRASVGFTAARESQAELGSALDGADMVFVAAGLGGGTGTGAAPLIAHLAREAGALVVGVVTTPFGFEGGRRTRMAAEGLSALRDQVDSFLVIDNDRLLGLGDPTMSEAFARADDILVDGVRGIGDLVTETGLVNLDFADVHAVLADGGRAVMGVGAGRGPDRAVHAVEAAAQSPLLVDDSIEGAGGVLMSFRADPRVGLGSLHRAAARIQAEVDDDAEILFGVTLDPDLDDEVHVTLVAAGLPEARAARAETIERERPAQVPRRRNALVMLEHKSS